MLHIKSGFELSEVLPAPSGSESEFLRTGAQTEGSKPDRIYHWTGGEGGGGGA